MSVSLTRLAPAFRVMLLGLILAIGAVQLGAAAGTRDARLETDQTGAVTVIGTTLTADVAILSPAALLADQHIQSSDPTTAGLLPRITEVPAPSWCRAMLAGAREPPLVDDVAPGHLRARSPPQA